MSVNEATLLGNVGRDPEIRTMQTGDKCATFSLATEERWTDKATGEKKQTTEWHNIVVFNQPLIPIIEQYVKKGSKIWLRGAIKTRSYTDRDGVERKVTEIVLPRFDGKISLLSSSQAGKRDEHEYGQTTTRQPASGGQSSSQRNPPASSQRLSDQLDDDIPF